MIKKLLFSIACIVLSACSLPVKQFSEIKEIEYGAGMGAWVVDGTTIDASMEYESGTVKENTKSIEITPKKYSANPIDNYPAAAGEELPATAPRNEFIGQLTNGMLAYDIPLVMTLWKKSRIELRVDDSISTALTSGMSEYVEVENVEISATMKADLSGGGFTITSLNSDTQLRKFTKPTIWKWDVTPNTTGKQTLKLKLICVLKRPGYTDENYDLDVFEVERTIKIDKLILIKGLLAKYWTAILGFVFSSGFIGWLIKRRKKK